MAKMIQIRNVPEKLHRLLKARAAQAGMSLSEYLLRELKKSADRPTHEELVARLRNLAPVDLGGKSIADWVREGREEHEDEIASVSGR